MGHTRPSGRSDEGDAIELFGVHGASGQEGELRVRSRWVNRAPSVWRGVMTVPSPEEGVFTVTPSEDRPLPDGLQHCHHGFIRGEMRDEGAPSECTCEWFTAHDSVVNASGKRTEHRGGGRIATAPPLRRHFSEGFQRMTQPSPSVCGGGASYVMTAFFSGLSRPKPTRNRQCLVPPSRESARDLRTFPYDPIGGLSCP